MSSSEQRSYYKINVMGPALCGKSSLVKRIVTHRFDNLPTQNAEFMGHASDSRSYVRIQMPGGLSRLTGRKKDAAASDVLLEMNDQIATISDGAMINDDSWYEVAMSQKLVETKNPKMKKEAAAVASANKKIADMIAAENKADKPEKRKAPTEHWEVKPEYRKGGGADDADGADGLNAGRPPPVRMGMRPEPQAHPLDQAPRTASQKRQAKIAQLESMLPPVKNPMQKEHGVFGYMVVFDVNSAESFGAAKKTVEQVMGRYGFNRLDKKPPPIACMLVGNKLDLGRRQVRYEEVAALMAEYIVPGALMAQIRRQKIDRALFKQVEALVSAKKADLHEVAKAESEGRSPEDEDWVKLQVAWLSDDAYNSSKRLRSELDPLRVTASHCTDHDTIVACYSAMLHAGIPNVEDELERLLACPALGLKYVEVSCHTNQDVHLLERVSLRALRMLPPLDSLKVNGAKINAMAQAQLAGMKKEDEPPKGPLGFLGDIFGGIGALCGLGGRPTDDATAPATSPFGSAMEERIPKPAAARKYADYPGGEADVEL